MISIFWKSLYNIVIFPSLFLTMHILMLFNSKIRGAILERYKIFHSLKDYKKVFGLRTIWFHVASMGEFEHIKPVIVQTKKIFTHSTIIVTFFSPSGFNNIKTHEAVDYILYLPFDFPWTIRRFISILKPDIFITAKYDLWPNVVWQAVKLQLPIFVINASLGPKSKRYKGIIGLFNREIFQHIREVLLSTEEDIVRLKRIAKNANFTVTGDTKFDQAIWRKENTKRNKIIDNKVVKKKRVFIAGSIWPTDWNVVIPVLNRLISTNKDLICFLIPHEPTDQHVRDIESCLEHPSIRYSRVANYKDEAFIVVNRIGILASLYARADFAYVGGSFKQNVHNVMEAAVFGIPVFYGPVHKNSFEAIELIDAGGSVLVTNKDDFEQKMLLMLHSKKDNFRYSQNAKNYVHTNSGATKLVMKKLIQYLS